MAVEVYERVRGLLAFRNLARQLTQGATSDRERIERLLEWTYLHVRPYFSAPTRVVADDPYRIAKRGFGYCDQSGHVFATLAHEAGLRARLYFLRNAAGASPHSVAQVFLDGDWVFVDTLIGRVLEVDGTPLTLDALQSNPSLLDQASSGARDILPHITAEDLLRGDVFLAFPYGGLTPWRRLVSRLGL